MCYPSFLWNVVCRVLVIDFADRGDVSSLTDPDRLLDLPPSAKLVYKTLIYEGPLTQGGLAEETWLSRRTLRHALEALHDAELVTEEVYIPDARKRLYRLAGGEQR